MKSIILKHLTQVLLIPAAAVTIGWYGHISAEIQSTWTASTWVAVVALAMVVAEIVFAKLASNIILAAVAVVASAITFGVPVYLFVDPFPVKVRGVMDHGGVILALAVLAVASLPWRLQRTVGVVEISAQQSAREHPTDSIDRQLQRDEEAIAHSAGFPGMPWGAALRRQDQVRRDDEERRRATSSDDY